MFVMFYISWLRNCTNRTWNNKKRDTRQIWKRNDIVWISLCLFMSLIFNGIFLFLWYGSTANVYFYSKISNLLFFYNLYFLYFSFIDFTVSTFLQWNTFKTNKKSFLSVQISFFFIKMSQRFFNHSDHPRSQKWSLLLCVKKNIFWLLPSETGRPGVFPMKRLTFSFSS